MSSFRGRQFYRSTLCMYIYIYIYIYRYGISLHSVIRLKFWELFITSISFRSTPTQSGSICYMDIYGTNWFTYKLFVLDRNTWNHTTVYKLLVLDRNTWNYMNVKELHKINMAQSAGAVEYTDSLSLSLSLNNMMVSPVMQELWGVRITPSLPLCYIMIGFSVRS